MKKKSIDLREIFLGLQNQMSSRLSLNKKILTHPVTKGDASELEWVDMLNTYLPRRYQVDKAFVIDHAGSVSEQIDIVIFDRHFSPFLLRQNGATYVPAESVYAVIEVKPSLTAATLRYAAKKAASVRRLERTSARIVHAAGVVDKPKSPFDFLAGILTLDGNVTPAVARLLSGSNGSSRIDFGCSLRQGAFRVVQNREGGRRVTKSASSDGLVMFFLHLIEDLQQLGTAPAIDIRRYIRSIRRQKGH